jgi:hypothetical protein
MIDRARVEQLIADMRVWDAWLQANGPLWDAVPNEVERANDATHPDRLIPFLGDVLALLAIVEALAANPPVVMETTAFDAHIYRCCTCGASAWDVSNIEHTVNCEVSQARELLAGTAASDV